jgi:UPF0716 protein FxsA
MRLLLLPFIVWIVAEFAALILIGGTIGIGWTLLLYLGVSAAGLWLLRRQGLAALRGLQRNAGATRGLAAPVFEGVLLALAGFLFLLPGFLSDLPALLLLIPGVRRAIAARWTGGHTATPAGRPATEVIDVEFEEIRDRPSDRARPGPAPASPPGSPWTGRDERR